MFFTSNMAECIAAATYLCGYLVITVECYVEGEKHYFAYTLITIAALIHLLIYLAKKPKTTDETETEPNL